MINCVNIVNDTCSLCVYRSVGNYAVDGTICHLILKCTIFSEFLAYFVDSLRDLNPNFNEISIISGIKCSNSTLDQICNIVILLVINFAQSMCTSWPIPTKGILKRFLAFNFRNLCLFSKHFKKNIGLVLIYNALIAESFLLSYGLKVTCPK